MTSNLDLFNLGLCCCFPGLLLHLSISLPISGLPLEVPVLSIANLPFLGSCWNPQSRAGPQAYSPPVSPPFFFQPYLFWHKYTRPDPARSWASPIPIEHTRGAEPCGTVVSTALSIQLEITGAPDSEFDPLWMEVHVYSVCFYRNLTIWRESCGCFRTVMAAWLKLWWNSFTRRNTLHSQKKCRERSVPSCVFSKYFSITIFLNQLFSE